MVVDGSLLLLKEMFGLEQPFEVDLSRTHLWVKAYDVPGLKQTPTFAKLLGDKVSSFAGCEETTLCGVDKSLNFKADIDITKPLKRGIRTLGRKSYMDRFVLNVLNYPTSAMHVESSDMFTRGVCSLI